MPHPTSPRPRRATRAAALVLCVAAGAAAVSCRDEPAAPRAAVAAPGARPLAAVTPPPGASASVTVQVPSAMRTAPFNVARTLVVPPGFSASVYARVPGARFMAVAPNGDLLVSNPGAGKVFVVRPGAAGADPTVGDWVAGLRNPHDVVFHTIAGVTYVYVAESHQVSRYVYNANGTPGARAVVVANLPDNSSPELQGAYGHQLKNIALDANGKLYVSIASATNASPSDILADPVRAAVYQYDAGGGGMRLFAKGLRNAEGLAVLPGTTTLYVAVNNRDNIAYPFHDDYNNDGTGDDFGKVIPAYVDNHPPEEFTKVVDGANYGWPYCNPNPDTPAGLNDMPYDRDVQNNADGSRLDCANATTPITKGIQAHSAPLGITFFQNTAAPAAYREGAALAYHGSWNRTTRTGYKVAFFPWDAALSRPADQVDLFTGWTNGGVWGRPVDVAVDAAGGILVSDDYSGTIYRFAYTAAPPPPPPAQRVASFTLMNADTDQPVPGYDPLPDGAALNLATLPSRNLSVRANTSPAVVGSVRFAYDANANYRTENSAPYGLTEQVNGTDWQPWTPATGPHTLRATPYTGADATGTAGTALTISFTVTDRRRGKPR